MGLANIYREVIFENQTISAGNHQDSRIIKLKDYQPDGFVSLQIAVSGSGELKIYPLLSINDNDYLQPSGTPDIVTGFTASSGPNGDGKDIFNIQLNMNVPFMILRFEETGGTNSVTVSAWLAIQ